MSDSVPTRGAHQSSPECVELKPPAGHRRIAVVKYSSSVPGGTLSPPPTLLYSTLLSLSIDRSLLLRAPPEEQQMWGTVWVVEGSENVNGICVCLFVCFSLFCPFWLIWGWGNVTTELQWREHNSDVGCAGGKVWFGGFFVLFFFGLHSPTHPHISSLPFSQLINCGEYPVCMHDLVNLLLSLKINVYPGVRLPDVSPTRLRSVIKNNATWWGNWFVLSLTLASGL